MQSTGRGAAPVLSTSVPMTTVPTERTAVVIDKDTPVGQTAIKKIPTPKIGDDEVLVEVRRARGWGDRLAPSTLPPPCVTLVPFLPSPSPSPPPSPSLPPVVLTPPYDPLNENHWP